MNKLLINNTFDFFNVLDVNLSTFCSFSINGHLHKSFYTEEELDELSLSDYVGWSQIKPICFNLIKGNKTPELLKITLVLPRKNYESCIKTCGALLFPDNISGLYLHLNYENGEITAITGTSLNIFTMDKSLDRYWDDTINTFLNKHFDIEVL